MLKINSFFKKQFNKLKQFLLNKAEKKAVSYFFSFHNLLIASILSLTVLFSSPLVKNLKSNTYTYKQSTSLAVQDKQLKKGQNIGVLSWNVCFLPSFAGTWEMGIAPWQERIKEVSQTILKENADLVCLQEVYDNHAAEQLMELLKEGGYGHFYYDIGKSGLGVNSGLFVASKFPLKNVRFQAHKTKKSDLESFFVNKGFFDFEVYARDRKIAHVFVTHLQHSQNDLDPLKVEKQIRKEQLLAIFKEMQKSDAPVLLVGDFNMPVEEYQTLEEKAQFQNFLFTKSTVPTTYQGELQGEKVELTLDYALLNSKGEPVFLFTRVLKDPQRNLQSDHLPLKTTLSFPL